MSDINVILSVTREQQVAIEEYCINSGLSISQYFLGLHNKFQIAEKYPLPKQTKSKEELLEQFPEKPMDEPNLENLKKKKPSK